MEHYVYLLYSDSEKIFYKGYSEHPFERLDAHNRDESRYTAGKGPWRLVYLEVYATKREALIREEKLKRGNAAYFQKLIASETNLLNKTEGRPVPVSTQ